MYINEQELTGFSMLEMNVLSEEDPIKVIFKGRWLVDCVNEPSVTHPEINRYTIAITESDSYFVFSEPLDRPALRTYEVYDGFEGMEESLDVPEGILEAIFNTHTTGPTDDCGPLDTE